MPADQNPLTLRFANWRQIEQSTAACWDGGILEVSNDGGTQFTQVPNSRIIAGGVYRGPVTVRGPLAVIALIFAVITFG